MALDPTLIRLVMELRQQGITNKDVLAAIERVPREAFVPPQFRDQAYENTALPIGNGQTISQPSVVAYMTEKLDLNSKHKVLEIGTGCGYQAAILAKLCRRVYSIERFRDLSRDAEKRLRELRINNVTTLWGDGTRGWPDQAPFDRIILTAGLSKVPECLFDQLDEDGILLAPVGIHASDQALIKFTKKGADREQENLWPVRFVPVLEGIVREDGG